MAGKYCKLDCPYMCPMCMDAELSALNQAEHVMDHPQPSTWNGWEGGRESVNDEDMRDAGYNIYPIKRFGDTRTTPTVPLFTEPKFYQLKPAEIIVTPEIEIEGHKRLRAGRVLE